MSLTQREIIAELERLEPAIAREYLRAVAELVSDANLATVTRMLANGDVAGAITALRLDTPALAGVLEQMRNTYIRGGALEVSSIRPPRGAGVARLRFDVRNVRAEQWLRTESSRFVTEIGAQQREAIRITVSEGVQLGRGPRQTALDLVGRVSPQTGRRVGGTIGISSQQAGYVANARAELLSGNPSQMRAYLNRARRDRRLDGIVNRAIKEGRAVSAADVDRIVGRYSDRLLLLRGETIARTEALAAFNAGSEEVYAQAIEAGQISAQNITGIWRAAGGARTRDTHRAMNGQRQAWGVPFQSPSGALLMHPGDSSLGAGASEIVNCRCTKQKKVDWLAQGLG